MCFMDWRIGRLIRTIDLSQDSDATGIISIPADRNRVGITFAPDVSGSVYEIGLDQSGAVTKIFSLSPSASALHFTLATHGDLPTHKFLLQNTTPGVTHFGVWTYIAPEWLIALGLKQLEDERKRYL